MIAGCAFKGLVSEERSRFARPAPVAMHSADSASHRRGSVRVRGQRATAVGTAGIEPRGSVPAVAG
ncbi:hypothetical protein AW168_08570 [Nocardia brasiliensis]|nr:hypothetical protein AW168_08570 [Nocardia brasiliensis]